MRFSHDIDSRCSFLIVFLEPEAAHAFMAFTKTPLGQLRFPDKGSDAVYWSSRPNTISPKVLNAARDRANPARRVLVFQKFPAIPVTNGKELLMYRLKTLGERYLLDYSVEELQIFPDKKEAHLVFSKIDTAIRVLECHHRHLLGPEFDKCAVTYGVDPSDRPFPVSTDIPAVEHTPMAGISGSAPLPSSQQRVMILKLQGRT